MNIPDRHTASRSCRAATIALISLSTLFAACSDEWDNHYSPELGNANQTLMQIIEEDASLSDFASLLKQTHLYNNARATSVTYADLLNADQTLTVWAPVNGTFRIDSLLDLCKTPQGDSLVSRQFVQNYISHNLYSIGKNTSDRVLLLNDKHTELTPTSFGHASYLAGKYNCKAKNGMLHTLASSVPFAYNIYENFTTPGRNPHIGDFLSLYERLELDEERSIQSGLIDGQKVYSDSVLIRRNPFFNILGMINSEDSNYIALIPSEKIWKPAVEEALPYFNYGSVAKADSIQRYWAYRMLLQDLIYNRNMQHLSDSAYSTSYNRWANPDRHVYYKPLSPGGILSSTFVEDTMACSNGVAYNLKAWPFTPEQIYFWPVKEEGESASSITNYSDCTLEYRSSGADSISNHGYLRLVPKTSSSNWTAKFQVGNTLAGTYDICVILLPKTVYNTASRDFKPNKFKATLSYTDAEGRVRTQAFANEITNNPYRVDTVKIGTFTFPVCNYQQQETTVSLQLECSIQRRETAYSRDMYLDCIYLKPNRPKE